MVKFKKETKPKSKINDKLCPKCKHSKKNTIVAL